MPRYDYRCADSSCDTVFEVTQSFFDEPVADCPRCGSSGRRLISRPAVHFKGSGFYVTDSRGSNGASGKSSEASESSGNGKSEAGSAEGSGAASGAKTEAQSSS